LKKGREAGKLNKKKTRDTRGKVQKEKKCEAGKKLKKEDMEDEPKSVRFLEQSFEKNS